MLPIETLRDLAGGRLGAFDVPCPFCGPLRRTVKGQQKDVFRIWFANHGFCTFHCARCDISGSSRDPEFKIDPAAMERQRAESADRAAKEALKQREKALNLWRRGLPLEGTLGSRYLASRGVPQWDGLEALRFLPGNGKFEPCLMAAFSSPTFFEPLGVHLTRLAPDGMGKAGTERDKIMLGRTQGWPLILGRWNEGMKLYVTEGIENALSIERAKGGMVWAAGAASRLPALAGVIPTWASAVIVVADPDDVGRQFAARLADALNGESANGLASVWVPSRIRDVNDILREFGPDMLERTIP